MVMILANTACIACYSSDQSTEHSSQVWIETVVRVFMACFVLEMLLKLTAGGNSAGNLADAAIVFAAAGAEMFVLVRGPSNFDQGVQNLGKAIITVRLVTLLLRHLALISLFNFPRQIPVLPDIRRRNPPFKYGILTHQPLESLSALLIVSQPRLALVLSQLPCISDNLR